MLVSSDVCVTVVGGAGIESDRAGIESDRAGIESDRAGIESDRAGIESDSTTTTVTLKTWLSLLRSYVTGEKWIDSYV
jgi:hypothetical protein